MRQRKQGLDYLPITGVRTDLKRFMNTFLEHNTVRYEQFLEVWRDRNMVYLCAGRATDREAREFVERVLLIAQEYFLPPFQFQVRVGGLYLLYAIYQIQPINPKAKIRLTPSQWQDTMYFQQQAAQQNHLDVVYVFQRLLQEQAFLFCYTPSEMSIHSTMKDLNDTEDDLADTLKEESTAVTSLFNYESLEKLSYLQDQYQQMKIGLAGPSATKPDKSLDVTLGDLVEDIVVLLQSFKERASSLSRHGQKSEETNKISQPVPVTTGSRRQLLKSQAYNQLAAQTNKRHSLQVVSSSPTKTNTTPKSDCEVVVDSSQKDSLSPGHGNRKQPANSPEAVDSGSSDDDTCRAIRSPGRKKMGQLQTQTTQRQLVTDQQPTHTTGRQLVSDQQPAVATKNVTRSNSNSRVPKTSIDDIHLMDGEISLVEDSPSFSINTHSLTPTWASLAQAEHSLGNMTPAELVPPVRKRGRPRLCPDAAYTESIAEIWLKARKTHSGQADGAQGSAGDGRQNQDSTSLINKIAFKFKRPERKKEQAAAAATGAAAAAAGPLDQSTGKLDQSKVALDQTTAALEQRIAITLSPPRKRGRPCKYNTEVGQYKQSAVSVYPKGKESEKKAKYELVYFPAGMKSIPALTSIISEVDSSATTSASSGNLSQAVRKMTAKVAFKASGSKKLSGQQVSSAEPENALTIKKSKPSVSRQPQSKTFTEIVVKKEAGKPAVIQSQTVHDVTGVNNSDTHPHTPRQTSPHTAVPPHTSPRVVRRISSAIACTAGGTLVEGEATHTKGSRSSQQKNKVLGQHKDNVHEGINRLREKCKRRLEEPEESVTQFIKKFMTADKEKRCLQTNSSPPQKVMALRKQSSHQQKPTSMPLQVVTRAERPQESSKMKVRTESDNMSRQARQSSSNRRVKTVVKQKSRLDSSSVQLRFL